MRRLLTQSLFVTLCLSGIVTTQAQSNYEPYSFTTLAGITPGSTDGAGSDARFNHPYGVAVDNAGNLYVADTYNNLIRKITPSGVVSTFAGAAGIRGGADGTGSAARFNQPFGVAVDSAGNVYVADTANQAIRKITLCGVVTTLAGQTGNPGSNDGTSGAARFYYPQGIAVDRAGNVYVADTSNHTIRKITPSGVVSTLAGLAGSSGSADGAGSAARFYFPNGVAVDNAGNLYVADSQNYTVRKITPAGAVSTLAGLAGSSGSVDGTGNGARFIFPTGVTTDGAGNVYVADAGDNTIRKITPAGDVTNLAGLAGSSGSSDGTGGAARFFYPAGVAVDSAGSVYVADTSNNTIRKIASSGAVGTLAGLPGSSGSADGTGSAARFYEPFGVAVDNGGNVYVADAHNGTIRKISPFGIVSTLAGLAGNPGYADGTGSAARFAGPTGVAVDSAGNVYVADSNNNTIRKITPSGVVSTLAGLAGTTGSADGTGNAARFNQPYGVAVDSGGNIYVADYLNSTIRKITSTGVVSTFAGVAGSFGSSDGPGGAARLFDPLGVAVDGAGNVYVADTLNYTIRKIAPSGVVRTLAGLARTEGSADGTGNAARFSYPSGVAVDIVGKVYVADRENNTIRVGVPAAPVITSPLAAIAAKAQKFVYQFEALQATSLAVSNLPAGLTFDPARSAIVGISTSTGTFPVTLSASNAVGTTSAVLTLIIQETPASGPVIVSSTSVTGRTAQPFQFQVITVNGSPAAQLTADCPCGLSADPVSGLISGTPVADGSSKTTLTVTDGSFVTTGTLQLTFTSDTARPVIVSADRANLVAGQAFSYQIIAPTSDSADPPSFSYLGTLPLGLSFDAKTGTISGVYGGSAARTPGPPDAKEFSGGILGTIQLFGTNFHGTSTFQLLFLKEPSGAVNISTRTTVGSGDNVLIGGFIVTGDAPEVVIIRAIGPSSKVNGALQDPVLELHSPTGAVVTNDDWRSDQEALIKDTGVPPNDDRESALVAALDPGNYTAIVHGKNNTSGIALVEVYDLGTAFLNSSSKARLAQISTRGNVLTADNVLIGGFIVKTVPTKVIVRAIGPSLAAFKIPSPLADPTLELHDGSGSLIFANDDWRTTQEQQIIDTTVPPTDDHESAIVATLNPGNYTAIVRGKANTTGVALVEVYGLQ
jgi:sugar lactone lactonase YvrE